MKPLASGCDRTALGWRNEDAVALSAASWPVPAYEDLNPYALPLPLAPEIAARMDAAIRDARDAASGHEAVIVSHQLPVWTARRFAEGKRLWHDPRSRECTLASVTTIEFIDDEITDVRYTEPAGRLLAASTNAVGA